MLKESPSQSADEYSNRNLQYKLKQEKKPHQNAKEETKVN